MGGVEKGKGEGLVEGGYLRRQGEIKACTHRRGRDNAVCLENLKLSPLKRTNSCPGEKELLGGEKRGKKVKKGFTFVPRGGPRNLSVFACSFWTETPREKTVLKKTDREGKRKSADALHLGILVEGGGKFVTQKQKVARR